MEVRKGMRGYKVCVPQIRRRQTNSKSSQYVL
jgi:hypothetical protein